jgi:hypothetical protein
LKGAGLVGVSVVAAVACGGDARLPLSTLDRTIVRDSDGDLVEGPGEPYSVRTDLAQAMAGREKLRRSLVTFHHLSDFRITDEESPLRSEWVEECATPISTVPSVPGIAQPAGRVCLVSQANRLDRSPVTAVHGLRDSHGAR